VFLEHCYRWVSSEGVLVFVVPSPAVGTCARLLASQFDRICAFRLEHPESVRFNQVVVFGRRKKVHVRGEPKGADELLRIAYKPHLLPVLNQEVVERYVIPSSSPATITYTGLPLDAIEDALQRSVAMQNARGILVRKHQKMTGRPVTPLHKGHVGRTSEMPSYTARRQHGSCVLQPVHPCLPGARGQRPAAGRSCCLCVRQSNQASAAPFSCEVCRRRRRDHISDSSTRCSRHGNRRHQDCRLRTEKLYLPEPVRSSSGTNTENQRLAFVADKQNSPPGLSTIRE